RDLVPGRADHARRYLRGVRQWALRRRRALRRRPAHLCGARGGVRQLAHRHAAGAAALTMPARVVALTIGDPNGIGPEIAVKAAAVLAETGALSPILVGNAAVIAAYAERHAPHLPLRELDRAG